MRTGSRCSDRNWTKKNRTRSAPNGIKKRVKDIRCPQKMPKKRRKEERAADSRKMALGQTDLKTCTEGNLGRFLGA